jgi:subtilisin family serine protease
MMMDKRLRQYLVLKADQRLLDVAHDFAALRRESIDILRTVGGQADFLEDKRIEVVAAPSLGLRSTLRDDSEPDQPPAEFVISYAFPNEELIQQLRNFVGPHLGDLLEDPGAVVSNIGADPVGHLCSGFPAADARPFGNRTRIREIMGIDALKARGLTGRGVNVVVIDRGLNRDEIMAHRPASWGGGLTPDIDPGVAPPTSHGMMVARNILDIAPEATLYDVPIIPMQITRPRVFASSVDAIYKAVVGKIRKLRHRSGTNTAWILVNAWAIFDRTFEWPPGDYTRNTHNLKWEHGHPLNHMMTMASVKENIDVVFGAGNCGQFTSTRRCGRQDRGEGRSIWGANAHINVVTVGAMSANGYWLGYSSQGPAPWGVAQKPDFCAPSQFYEDHDAFMVNSGTSAATGLTAGVIAAIRSNPSGEWGPDGLYPIDLKSLMNKSATGQAGVWNERTGHGMLNARNLLVELDRWSAAGGLPQVVA